jgi:SAM-dependent methyltransferase
MARRFLRVSGTEGYDDTDFMVRRFEGFTFMALHEPILALLPPAPARVLDIGAGSGRDAAGFAALGYRVVAVEPMPGLRQRAAELHPSPSIEWVDDSLPDLARMTARGETLDVVMMTAVWMHFDEAQRRRGMPVVAALVRPGGVMSLSLRHGPIPPERRMFAVTGDETVALAAEAGFECILRIDEPAAFTDNPSVTWTQLAFRKRAA